MEKPMPRTIGRLVGVALTSGVLVAATLAPPSASASERSREGSSHHARLGYTQVTVAPSTLDALVSLGVTPGVVAPAKLASASPLAVRFPITGFSFENLRIRHSGGVTLTAGSTTVKLTRFNIDLGRLRVSGRVAGVGRVDLFKIRASDAPRLGAVKLVLTATAAGALNGAFGTTALTENFLFGYGTPRPFARI
jgi:hypothetical protein